MFLERELRLALEAKTVAVTEYKLEIFGFTFIQSQNPKPQLDKNTCGGSFYTIKIKYQNSKLISNSEYHNFFEDYAIFKRNHSKVLSLSFSKKSWFKTSKINALSKAKDTVAAHSILSMVPEKGVS